MKLSLLALLLVGAVNADHNYAWNNDNEYHYLLESRSFAGLEATNNQYSGILMRGVLKIQPRNETILHGKLSQVEVAAVQAVLPNGWDSKLEGDQNYQPLATSDKSFEMKLERGIIKEIIFDRDVPTWEVNLHKSALSQLQVDTQGENMAPSRGNQPPADEKNGNAMFKTMEDSVGGNCEVFYDITPLPRALAEQRLQVLAAKEFKSEGGMFEIMKTKDYDKCEQRPAVHFGVPGKINFEPGTGRSGDFLYRSSISEVIITGNLKAFTVHSSVTTEKVILSPHIHDKKSGVVASRVNLTLSKVQPVQKHWSIQSNPGSVGNLVYTYEQPFSPSGNDRHSELSILDWPNQASNSGIDQANHEDHFDDSSSSDESEEDLNIWSGEKKYSPQPMPTLNEAPQYPMLPLFIGNKGKALSVSKDFGLGVRVKKLVTEIGTDLQSPNSMLQEQTLEKFTILIGVLRTMSVQQLREVQNSLNQPPKEIDENDEGQKVERSTWKAFRDAIASTGTAPALVLITEWIKERKLNMLETMLVISTLAKSAREPTGEYMNTFFKLAMELEARRESHPKNSTTSEALEDDAVSTSAILSFTELLRYAQTSRRTSYNRFPMYVFGTFGPKVSNELHHDYFPYLIEKLERGIADDSARATVYIRALGNVAHPRLLSAFEPYLEGTKSSTVYQRQMMVIALDKLLISHPGPVMNLAYRIYQNTGESFRVRSLAVFVLMKTKPPLTILQRMAQFTNQDISKHVNAVVKSLIQLISELEDENEQTLAQNAREVLPLLTSEIYGFEYSGGFGLDKFQKELNTHWAAEMSWIDGVDSEDPQGIYMALDKRYGGFQLPKSESGIMVTSVRDFCRTLEKLFEKEGAGTENLRTQQTSTEDIVAMLGIEEKTKENLEFFFLARNMYRSFYFMIGENFLGSAAHEYIRRVASSLRSGYSYDLMTFQNFEFTIALPTATGLPFVFDFQLPQVLKPSGKIQTSAGLSLSLHLALIFSQKVQSRFGFITPFDGHHYTAGVDKNVHIYIPMSTEISIDTLSKQFRLQVEPIKNNVQTKLIHYSIVPFTSHQDIKELRPTASKNCPGTLVMGQGVQEEKKNINDGRYGWSFETIESKVESYPGASQIFASYFSSFRTAEFDSLHFVHPKSEAEVKFYSLDITELGSSSRRSISLLINWDTMFKNQPHGDQLASSHHWASKLEITEPSDKTAEAPLRKQEMMVTALTGLSFARALAVDFVLEISGQEKNTVIISTALGSSKVDDKFKALLYASSNFSGFPTAACIVAQGSRPFLPPFDSNEIPREELRTNLDVKMSLGSNSCLNGQEIDVIGRQWQSEEFRESMRENRNRYYTQGIQKTFMDRISIAVHKAAKGIDNTLTQPRNLMTMGVQGSSDPLAMLDVHVKPGTKTAVISMQTPMMDVDMTREVELTDIEIPLFSLQSEHTYQDRDLREFGKPGPVRKISAPEGVCLLENNFVHTFDGLEYSFNANSCWSAAMTSVPETDWESSKSEIMPDKQASVIIRQDKSDTSKREASVSLGKTEILLRKVGNEVTVKWNNTFVDLSAGLHFVEDELKYDIQISKLSGGSVHIQSDAYGLRVTFDGKRLLIKMEDKYRHSVRGLCGNFDSEPSNDLLTPLNRLSSEPRDFARFYVLPFPGCRSISEEVRRQEMLLPADMPNLTNVVSDRDAGRTNHSGRWSESTSRRMTIVKTKIIFGEGETCFSLRPIPTCAPGTTPRRVKSMMLSVYCLANGESTKRLSDRIHGGANPDLSQRPESRKMMLDVARYCSAAV